MKIRFGPLSLVCEDVAFLDDWADDADPEEEKMLRRIAQSNTRSRDTRKGQGLWASRREAAAVTLAEASMAVVATVPVDLAPRRRTGSGRRHSRIMRW